MKRFLTGAIIAVLLVGAFLLREVNIYLFDICIGVFTLFASLEVSKLLINAKKGALVLPVLLYTAVSYLFLLLGINNGLSVGKLLIGLVLLLIVLFICVIAYTYYAKERTMLRMELDEYKGSRKAYALSSTISTVFNCIYPSLILLLLIIVNHIDAFSADLTKLSSFGGADIGLILLLTIFVTSIFSDVFAYFVGMLIGGKKLCPKISEHKTISGAIGALFGSVLGGVVLYILMCTNGLIVNGFDAINLTLVGFIFISICASIFTQLGDLFESLLKRKANVKDSGNILPGHGGLMDRADGLTFNTVFILVLFVILLI